MDFREKKLHGYKVQLFDYNVRKYFCPNVHISGRKIFFAILLKLFFMVKSKNCKKYQKYIHLGRHTFIHRSRINVVHVNVNSFI